MSRCRLRHEPTLVESPDLGLVKENIVSRGTGVRASNELVGAGAARVSPARRASALTSARARLSDGSRRLTTTTEHGSHYTNLKAEPHRFHPRAGASPATEVHTGSRGCCPGCSRYCFVKTRLLVHSGRRWLDILVSMLILLKRSGALQVEDARRTGWWVGPRRRSSARPRGGGEPIAKPLGKRCLVGTWSCRRRRVGGKIHTTTNRHDGRKRAHQRRASQTLRRAYPASFASSQDRGWFAGKSTRNRSVLLGTALSDSAWLVPGGTRSAPASMLVGVTGRQRVKRARSVSAALGSGPSAGRGGWCGARVFPRQR